MAMKLALIQFDARWEDKEANLARAEVFIKRAADEGMDAIIFPETFSTGFSMNVAKVAEDWDGPTERGLKEMAGRHKITVVAGYAEKASSDKARNLAAAIGPDGSILMKAEKIHPFSLAGEDKVFVPGDELGPFLLAGVPAAVFICYDLRFPEVFRRVARDVSLILVIANWPESRADHFHALLKARAIENQCFTIGVNRTGRDGNGIQYAGGSAAYCPLGKELLLAGSGLEYVAIEIDPDETRSVRSRFPFLKDMRNVGAKRR